MGLLPSRAGGKPEEGPWFGCFKPCGTRMSRSSLSPSLPSLPDLTGNSRPCEQASCPLSPPATYTRTDPRLPPSKGPGPWGPWRHPPTSLPLLSRPPSPPPRRKLRTPRPWFLKDLLSQKRESLYVVTEAVEVMEATTLQSLSGAEGAGQLSFLGLGLLKVQGGHIQGAGVLRATEEPHPTTRMPAKELPH